MPPRKVRYFGPPLPPYRINHNALLIESRLKIKCMLHQFDDAQLAGPLTQIVELFGGDKSLIAFIIENAPHQKLEELYTIIKDQKIKQNEEMSENINSVKQVNKHVIEKGSNPFDKLANEYISHICGYLNKDDINIFKLASMQIGIVCMSEMNKITIGSINGNNFLHPEINLYHAQYKLENVCQMNRFGITKTYHFIMEQWAKMYQIPMEYQILFHVDFECLLAMQPEEYTKLRAKHICVRDAVDIRDVITPVYLVCDIRKLVLITAKKSSIMDFKLFDEDESYELFVLQYYDITSDTLSSVQLLLCECDNDAISDERLFKYIQHEFISVNDRNDRWYTQLKQQVDQMFIHSKSDSANKLKIKFSQRNTPCSDSLRTVQLNYPIINTIYPREIVIKGKLWFRGYKQSKKKYFWKCDKPKELSWNPWHDNGLIAPWILKYGQVGSSLDIYYDSMLDDTDYESD